MRVSPNRRRGFTLLELSIATMMGMLIGAMTLALFNQQLAFLKIYQKQDFLSEEAPLVSMHVSRILAKAERFRLYDSVSDALSNTRPRMAGPFDDPPAVVLLEFRMLDASVRKALLVFEDWGGGKALNYYAVPTGVVSTLGAPQWSITRKAKDVGFVMEDGVLRMILTGPEDEQIIYSGTMQQ
jgi:hypothetical protein